MKQKNVQLDLKNRKESSLCLFPEQDDEYIDFCTSTKNSRKMAKNATRFKMAVQTNLNRGGKNIRKTFLTKMYLILRDLSVPRIENFMRFKFRVNKIEKEREKTIRLTDSVECLTRFPLRSYPSLAFTRNKNPSPLLTISRFPPRNLSSRNSPPSC